MGRRIYLGLFLAGLLITIAAASLEHSPGYMDADYYYAGALRLISGQGGSEPYVWNYLNDPAGLPALSFSYWMPLVSVLAAGGLAAAPAFGFWGARLGFILLAACVPPLTALISFRLTNRPPLARLAGLFALIPGFYLAYLPTTDGFSIYMVLGSLFFLLSMGEGDGFERWPWEVRLFALGILAGLLHLTRADGLLWLAGAGWVAITAFLRGRRPALDQKPELRYMRLVSFGLAVIAGYILIMAPWYARNLGAWGSLFPPGGSRAIWITEYEQTMLYPASLLTPPHWLSAGWLDHLQTWKNALINNAQTAVGVQGQIILFPFMLFGMWKLRRCSAVRLGGLMWAATAGVMTLVFPFAGINGGFFHSGAGIQPLLWAVAPVGLEGMMFEYARWRKVLSPQEIYRFTAVLLVAVAAMLSIFIYFNRVVGARAGSFNWSASQEHYRLVEQALVEHGAPAGSPVLVNNPPGYWLAAGRSAVVIPYGDEQMLLSAAHQYGVRYLVLEISNPRQLAGLYKSNAPAPEFTYLDSIGSTRLYQIMEPK